jgi:hypothetical protein
MTFVTAALTALVFVMFMLSAWLWARQLAALDRAAIGWRVAMDFIAEEGCDMPHEFAACFVAGNREAMSAKFPAFAEYAARRTAELEEGAE